MSPFAALGCLSPSRFDTKKVPEDGRGRKGSERKGTSSSGKFGHKRTPPSNEVQSNAGSYWLNRFEPKKDSDKSVR